MTTEAEVKTNPELQRLESALRRAQNLVADHEKTVAAANYGLKNAKGILYGAEDALSAYYDRLDANTPDRIPKGEDRNELRAKP